MELNESCVHKPLFFQSWTSWVSGLGQMSNVILTIISSILIVSGQLDHQAFQDGARGDHSGVVPSLLHLRPGHDDPCQQSGKRDREVRGLVTVWLCLRINSVRDHKSVTVTWSVGVITSACKLDKGLVYFQMLLVHFWCYWCTFGSFDFVPLWRVRLFAVIMHN